MQYAFIKLFICNAPHNNYLVHLRLIPEVIPQKQVLSDK